METETRLWRCIADHANQQRGMFQASVKPADIARATGISEQLLSKWRRKPTLPNPEQLAAIRRRTQGAVPGHARGRPDGSRVVAGASGRQGGRPGDPGHREPPHGRGEAAAGYAEARPSLGLNYNRSARDERALR